MSAVCVMLLFAAWVMLLQETTLREPQAFIGPALAKVDLR